MPRLGMLSPPPSHSDTFILRQTQSNVPFSRLIQRHSRHRRRTRSQARQAQNRARSKRADFSVGPKLLVRKGGLEPPRFYPPDPKSGASANSATFALPNYTKRLEFPNYQGERRCG